MEDKIARAWERTRRMRPIIEANREQAERLRRLPDAVARAFVDANVYRLLVPEEYGGEGIDPVTYYELAEEVSFYDGSAGWNYAIGATGGVVLGGLSARRRRDLLATADCAV